MFFIYESGFFLVICLRIVCLFSTNLNIRSSSIDILIACASRDPNLVFLWEHRALLLGLNGIWLLNIYFRIILNACRITGIIVDLFSDGKILPQLEEVLTYSVFLLSSLWSCLDTWISCLVYLVDLLKKLVHLADKECDEMSRIEYHIRSLSHFFG